MTQVPPSVPSEFPPLRWWNDHQFLRVVWTNFYKIDAEVWRHNHPNPARLAELKAMGAASVLSLRGDTSELSLREAEVCARLGLTFRGVGLRAVALPKREAIIGLIDALRDLPKPVVIHCKSGSDRTGLASVIYLHVIKGVPLAEARGQLSLRYLHNRWGKARIVNRFLDAYVAAHAANDIGFEDWVKTGYDRAALLAAAS